MKVPCVMWTRKVRGKGVIEMESEGPLAPNEIAHKNLSDCNRAFQSARKGGIVCDECGI